MYASVLLLALSGSSVPAALVETPVWFTDYSVARQRGKEAGKPLAVFLGAGRAGWEQVSRAGKLGQEAQQILASRYVCAYVDTRELAGKQLAAAFEVPQGLGLVISDSSGNLQAFHHAGDFADQDLHRYLQRYSDPERTVRTTETNPTRQVSYYAAPSAGAPAAYSVPFSAPRYFGGGRSC